MIEVQRENARFLGDFFSYTSETTVLSYTQGYMGQGWVDNFPDVSCAQVIVGDFCFVTGNSASREAVRMVQNVPPAPISPWLLFIPGNDKWCTLIEKVQINNYEKFLRFAIKKEPHVFSRDLLHRYVEKLPDDMTLVPIDETLYNRCLSIPAMHDFCSQFDSAGDYRKRGLGFCVLHGNKIAAGASSYTVYRDGIEIEIATDEHYRRRGLATVCAARLILACLDRGLYPSWDAANPESLDLAEKLGYHFDHAYYTYAVVRPRV